MRRQLELFLTALGFFTRLPVPAWLSWSPERLAHAARYLALVGWVVGLAGAAAYAALSWLLPPALAVVLSMAVTVRLTGAFHEDGFADTCDGLGGGWDKAQVLAIMKDSRIGSYGAIGIVLLLLAKAAALVELANADSFGAGGLPAGIVAALLVAHPLSRLAATCLMHLLPYARDDGSGKSTTVAQRLTPAGLAIACACGLLPLALLSPAQALAAAAATAFVTICCARLFMRRLGGHTGDLLGAAQQLAELACYAGLLAAPRLSALLTAGSA